MDEGPLYLILPLQNIEQRLGQILQMEPPPIPTQSKNERQIDEQNEPTYNKQNDPTHSKQNNPK